MHCEAQLARTQTGRENVWGHCPGETFGETVQDGKYPSENCRGEYAESNYLAGNFWGQLIIKKLLTNKNSNTKKF